ncbi:MFS transporter [Brucella microti]|uniref:MFS transporter n=1 Tax=Brucella microti TaxID=444163 RepID=UPI0015C5324A|nr:MFS transporter [Brucella microti]
MPDAPDDKKEAPEAAPAAPQPAHMPLYMSIIYIAASMLLWSTRGLSMYFISANTQQIQGSLGATLTETTWLVAAYMAPFASLTILLLKIRTQFGLRRFAEVAIAVFLVASLLHLLVYDVWSAIPVRFIAGAAAVPISSVGFLYMLEAFPPDKKRTWGLSLALTCSGAAGPFARIISPMLFDIGQWQQLYMLEIGLALACFAVVYVLPLTQIPRAKVLHWLDFVAYTFIAIGFGALVVVLVQGKNYWWFEAPWIGVCLAISILSLAIAAAIELNRDQPLMNLHWLASPEILRFTLILLVFRMVLAEQTSGALGLFQVFGLQDAQSKGLYTLILLASFAGGITCGALLKVERVPVIFGFALLCIAVGAFLDSHATNLTRPHNVYVSQGLIAFGGALFLPPAMLAGITKAMKQGPAYMTSFIVVFLFTQNIGGLIGSALFSTFISIREKYHSAHLVEQLVMSDPLVVQRVQALSGTYAKVLADQGLTKAEGLVLLGQQVTKEATILSYNDAFLAISVIAAIALCCQVTYRVYEAFRARRSALAVMS